MYVLDSHDCDEIPEKIILWRAEISYGSWCQYMVVIFLLWRGRNDDEETGGTEMLILVPWRKENEKQVLVDQTSSY